MGMIQIMYTINIFTNHSNYKRAKQCTINDQHDYESTTAFLKFFLSRIDITILYGLKNAFIL